MLIAIQVVLTICTLLAGRVFIQALKRNSFMRAINRDPQALRSYITEDGLRRASQKLAPLLASGTNTSTDYLIAISSWIKADQMSVNRLKVIAGIVILACAAWSLYLNVSFLWFNLVAIVPFGFLGGLSSAGKVSAIDNLIDTGYLLKRLYELAPSQCESFISQAYTLRNLFEVVRDINYT